MKNFKPMLIIASISLLTLVACNKPKQAATETIPTPAYNSTEKAPTKTSAAGNTDLLTVVSKTETAVKSGNFVEAKKEFDKISNPIILNWTTFKYNRFSVGWAVPTIFR
jgi:hypothetical protein